jgi:hypothetical protein
MNPFVSHLDHIEDLSDTSGENPDLAIRLHPGDHEAREPRTIRYQWDITKDYRYPDRVRKLVYLINGMVPSFNVMTFEIIEPYLTLL